LAPVAEESGFSTIAVPDSAFYPEHVSAAYPYSPDGRRFWSPDTPFVEPFVALAAMAALTTTIGFVTNVIKLPLRDPLLVAKQLSSLAVLSKDRITLGVGLSWIPEEFAWTRTDMRTRGARLDESIDIIRLVCGGGGPQFVEHHGRHYDFGRLMISPAPERAVPIIVGGHSAPALRRAAQRADGWISVQTTTAEVLDVLGVLGRERAAAGRHEVPFSISVLPIDTFDADGYRRLFDAGVTDIQVVPWYVYGGDPTELGVRRDAIRRFGDEVIARFV
jgi:probable F420-dependent oxidoreductase